MDTQQGNWCTKTKCNEDPCNLILSMTSKKNSYKNDKILLGQEHNVVHLHF